MTEPQGPLPGPESDDLALRYPVHGPDEVVPWWQRLSRPRGRRAAQLQPAKHQIGVDNLATAQWPVLGPGEGQGLGHWVLDSPASREIPDAEPDPPATAGEIEKIREQAMAGEPLPDIYSAGDMKIWRARQAEYELEAGA